MGGGRGTGPSPAPHHQLEEVVGTGDQGMCQISTRANPWGQGDARSDDPTPGDPCGWAQQALGHARKLGSAPLNQQKNKKQQKKSMGDETQIELETAHGGEATNLRLASSAQTRSAAAAACSYAFQRQRGWFCAAQAGDEDDDTRNGGCGAGGLCSRGDGG
ncbi:hypothetical protein BS78_06G061700 [Paspalum vaginatum]|nr:hypothetical protein BS78_06G061700 [Paspalum vaginatum]